MKQPENTRREVRVAGVIKTPSTVQFEVHNGIIKLGSREIKIEEGMKIRDLDELFMVAMPTVTFVAEIDHADKPLSSLCDCGPVAIIGNQGASLKLEEFYPLTPRRPGDNIDAISFDDGSDEDAMVTVVDPK